MKKTLALVMMLVFALTAFAYAAPANSFVDVPANDPAYADVQALVKAGLVTGVDGKYDGSKPVTRYEMASVVAKLLKNANQANAKDLERIQRLAVEFQAQLEEMDVRVTAVETKGKEALDWFSPTMPKWSGDFYIYYSNGSGFYTDPYKTGTGAIINQQSNSAALELNLNGKLSGKYDMNYYAGFALSVPYMQQPDAGGTNGLSGMGASWSANNGNVYIDGRLPLVDEFTSATYGAKTTFAFGQVGYAPGSGFAVDSTLNGIRVSNSFDSGLNIDGYFGVDVNQLAYAGYWVENQNRQPGSPEGYYYYGMLINPNKNVTMGGENGFDMYGQKNTGTDEAHKWTGCTGYSSNAVAVSASYPIGAFTIKGAWSDVILNPSSSPSKPYVGQIVDEGNDSDGNITYSQIASVTQITDFQNLDLGVFYDDGYWHGSLRGAMSPTYCGIGAGLPQNFLNTFAANGGMMADVHAGSTDTAKPWTYDAYLKYYNVGPFMSYNTSAPMIDLGGVSYRAGVNFVPIKGTQWNNYFTYIQSAIPSNVGTSTSSYDYSSKSIFQTYLYFYF